MVRVTPSIDDPVRRLSGGTVPADEAGFVATLGRRLGEAGLPVDRLILYRRTLHPDVLARAVAWTPGQPLEIYDRDHGLELSQDFAGSALQRAMETGKPQAFPLDPSAVPAWTCERTPGRCRLVELVVLPLGLAQGPASALVVGTTRPGGFAASGRAMLERIAPAAAALYGATLRSARR